MSGGREAGERRGRGAVDYPAKERRRRCRTTTRSKKEILEKGKAEAENEDLPDAVRAWLASPDGGTIYAADIYAAYRLLESFIEEIDTNRHERRRLETRTLYLQGRAENAEREVERLQESHTDLAELLTACNRAREEHVAEIERLQADVRMLSDRFRATVLALGDVSEEWEGTVAEGVDLINANVERVQSEIKRLRALVDAVGEDVCQTALRLQQRTDARDRGGDTGGGVPT